MVDENPRGIRRAHDGSGKGVGMPDGNRGGRNTEPCETGGSGHGEGEGRGGGRGRRKSE